VTSDEAAWTAGEPLAAVLDRAVREAVAAVHADVAAVNMGLPVSVPVPPLPPVCPGAWTRDAWEQAWAPEWPHGQLRPATWVHGPEQRADLLYAAERALRRAVTDFLDAWERGDVQLIGRRSDGAVEAVPGHLRHSRFVALHPLTGMLLPAVWRGQPPPPDVQCHSYSDLKVLRMELPPPAPPPAPEAPPPESEPDAAADLQADVVGEPLKPLGGVDLKALADAWTEQHPTWGQRRLFEEWNETKRQKQGKKRSFPERPRIGIAMFRPLPGLGRPRS
jgi:hypothetical protein